MTALSRTEEPVQLEGSGLEPAPRRSRRSVFLHSGIRICPRESVSEVLANHQAYYQLRGAHTLLASAVAMMSSCKVFVRNTPVLEFLKASRSGQMFVFSPSTMLTLLQSSVR